MVIIRKRIAVDLRRDRGALDADLVDRLVQLPSVAGQCLQIVADLIVGVRILILIFDDKDVFVVFLLPAALCVNGNSLLAGIIRRFIRDLGCDRKAWGSYGVRQIAFNQLINLAADLNSLIVLVKIEIVNGELIGLDRRKNGNSVERSRYGRADFDLCIGRLILPILEDLALNKGIVRQGGDFVTDVEIDEVL